MGSSHHFWVQPLAYVLHGHPRSCALGPQLRYLRSRWGAQRTLPPTRLSVLHQGHLNAPGASLRWPKSRSSSCSPPGAGHGHLQHEHQRHEANACSPRAGWGDRTKPQVQQHPLKFDGIYFPPLSSSQADAILCKPKRTIQSTRNSEPKGCNISGEKNENQSKRSHREGSWYFALQTAGSTALQHHPSSCGVTRRLQPWVLPNSGRLLGGKHGEGFAFACCPSSRHPRRQMPPAGFNLSLRIETTSLLLNSQR